MRQSTRGNNFKSLIKDEFIKRFEQTILDEIKQYQDCQKENEKKFLLINTRLDEIQKQQKEVAYLLINAKIDFAKEFVNQKNDLFEKFESQRRYINEKINFIDCLAKELCEKSNSNVTQNDLSDQISMLQSQMFNIGLNAEKEKRNISELIYQIKEEICDYVEDIEKKMSDNLTKLSKDLFATNESVDTSKIDSSGVLKELQAYKKSMLILEKKIEHIYTLIDRSKRGGLLAKPEH